MKYLLIYQKIVLNQSPWYKYILSHEIKEGSYVFNLVAMILMITLYLKLHKAIRWNWKIDSVFLTWGTKIVLLRFQVGGFLAVKNIWIVAQKFVLIVSSVFDIIGKKKKPSDIIAIKSSNVLSNHTRFIYPFIVIDPNFNYGIPLLMWCRRYMEDNSVLVTIIDP